MLCRCVISVKCFVLFVFSVCCVGVVYLAVMCGVLCLFVVHFCLNCVMWCVLCLDVMCVM